MALVPAEPCSEQLQVALNKADFELYQLIEDYLKTQRKIHEQRTLIGNKNLRDLRTQEKLLN